MVLLIKTEDKMNHTTTKSLAIIAVLAAITAALTGTIAITIQTAAAYSGDSNDPNGNNIDKENSGTNFKFKEKDKNNCSGFTVCCNIAGQGVNGLAIIVCPIE
jgi:hypothetical protein